MANQPVEFPRPTLERMREAYPWLLPLVRRTQASIPWLQPVLRRVQASVPWLQPSSLRAGQKAPAWLWGLLLLGLLGVMSLAANLGTPASAPGAGGVVDTVGLGLSALFKLCLVLGLLYASLGLYKRYRGAISSIQGRQITILESSRLSPRQAVHLIQVRDQTLLIGATDQGLTLLVEIEAQPAGAELQPAEMEAGQADLSLSSSATPSFEQSLSRLQKLGEPGGLGAS